MDVLQTSNGRTWTELELDPILRDWAMSALVELERESHIDIDFYRNQDPVRAALLERILGELRAGGSGLQRAASSPEPARVEASATLPGVELERRVGHDGIGLVYEARTEPFGLRVAVKLLPCVAFFEPAQRERLDLVLRTLSRLKPAGLVPIHEVQLNGSHPHIIMDFVDGCSLSELTCPPADAPPRTPREAAIAMRLDPRSDEGIRNLAQGLESVARGLDQVHEVGILHRNIKPSNILIDRNGRMLLTDFGMSYVGRQDDPESDDPLRFMRYTPPEEVSGTTVTIDRRSDIYSLGAVLYEALTGRPPFDQSDRLSLLDAIAHSEPRSVRSWNPAIPAPLATITHRAMALDPQDRYPSADDLAEDLRRFGAGLPIVARRPTVLERVRSFRSRHQGALRTAVLGTLILGLLAGAGLSFINMALRSSLERNQRVLTAYQLQDAERVFQRGHIETALQMLEAVSASAWQPRYSAAMLNTMIRSEVDLLKGHTGWVIGSSLSLDGNTLVTSDTEGNVLTWRVRDRKNLARLRPTGAPILRTALSPDGQRLLAQQGTIASWAAINDLLIGDTASGNWIGKLQTPAGETISDLALIDDGQTAVVSSSNPQGHTFLRYWNLAKLGQHIPPTRAAQFQQCWLMPQHNLFVAQEFGGSVSVRPLCQPDRTWSSVEPHAPVRCVSLNTNRTRLAVGDDQGNVSLWPLDGASAPQVWNTHRGEVRNLWFDAADQNLISLCVNDGVGIRRLSDGSVQRLDLKNEGAEFDAELDTSTHFLVSITRRDQNIVQVWDLHRSQLVGTYPGRNSVWFRTRFLNDGTLLLYAPGPSQASRSTRYGNILRLWRPSKQTDPTSFRHNAEVWSTRFTRDGRSLISAGDDVGDSFTLRRWNLETGELIWEIKAANAMVSATSLDPTEQFVAASILGTEGLARIFRVSDGREVLTLRGHSGKVWDVAYSPDGTMLATAGEDGAILLRDPVEGSQICRLTGFTRAVRSIAFSADGSQIAAGGGDGFIQVWSLPEGIPVRRLSVPDQVRDLAYSPTDHRLGAALASGILQVWKADSSTIEHTIYSGETELTSLAFNVDGQEIAAVGLSGIVNVWDAQTGQVLLHLGDEDNIQINSLSFRADGLGLVTGDHTGRIRLWDASAPEPAIP